MKGRKYLGDDAVGDLVPDFQGGDHFVSCNPTTPPPDDVGTNSARGLCVGLVLVILARVLDISSTALFRSDISLSSISEESRQVGRLQGGFWI